MKCAAIVFGLFLSACNNAEPPLIADIQIDEDSILAPLTDTEADPVRGKLVFSERDQAHCVLCHVVTGLDVPFQGNVGPDLSLVSTRLSPAQLRLRVVDYQIVSPGALMPSYYRIHDLYQVQDDYIGQSILTAQQVEDLVAYLSELD